MAKNKGVSLSSKDATRAVGVGPGPGKITAAEFAMYAYGGNRKPVPACLVTYERNDQELEPEPYTVGNGWKISEDGQSLVPKAGQSGLPDSCNFMHLIRSLEANGMPSDFLTKPEDLVGCEGALIQKPLEKIKDKKTGAEGRERSVLVFEDDSIESSPWEEGDKPKAKAKKKAKPADDDDDDEPEPDDDDDDDEEEKPKAKAKAKAKAKPAADDDDDDSEGEEDDADEDVDEQAGEALIEALDDGDLKLAKVEGAVAAQLKGNKAAKVIAKRAADPKFLKKELGWEFDGKIVSKS